jgi:hypothetical protein
MNLHNLIYEANAGKTVVKLESVVVLMNDFQDRPLLLMQQLYFSKEVAVGGYSTANNTNNTNTSNTSPSPSPPKPITPANTSNTPTKTPFNIATQTVSISLLQIGLNPEMDIGLTVDALQTQVLINHHTTSFWLLSHDIVRRVMLYTVL